MYNFSGVITIYEVARTVNFLSVAPSDQIRSFLMVKKCIRDNLE